MRRHINKRVNAGPANIYGCGTSEALPVTAKRSSYHTGSIGHLSQLATSPKSHQVPAPGKQAITPVGK